MTLGEVRDALKREGVDLSPSQIDYAIRAGRVEQPSLDGAGNRQFAARHIAALRAYAAEPRRPGRSPRRAALEVR